METEKLYVVGQRRINMIDLDGTGLQHIPVKLDAVYNVAVHKDQMYCVNLDTDTLCAFDHSGNQLWTFYDNSLQWPRCYLHDAST